MTERGKLMSNVAIANGARKYKSRSASAPKNCNVSTPAIFTSKQTPKSLPVAYYNSAFSIEQRKNGAAIRSSSCSVSTVSLENTCSDVPEIFSSVVEDAVRRVIEGSLQDLHQDVGRIHRTLSQLGTIFLLSF